MVAPQNTDFAYLYVLLALVVTSLYQYCKPSDSLKSSSSPGESQKPFADPDKRRAGRLDSGGNWASPPQETCDSIAKLFDPAKILPRRSPLQTLGR